MSQDISFYLNDTWEIDGVANDVNGNPIPLADVELKISTANGLILTMNKSSGVLLTDAINGKYKIPIPNAQKTKFNPAIWFLYQIRAIGTDGGSSIVDVGHFIVMRGQ